MVPYHIIVVVGTLLTLLLGADSIEKTNKVMMPLFFIIFLVLAVRVALLPGAAEGYRFMLTPHWDALKTRKCGSAPWDRLSFPCPSPAAA